MFSYLEGKKLYIDGISLTILVENTGLGLEVLCSPKLLFEATKSEKISIFVHHHITDASEILFGFASLAEKNLFKNLIKVNGIGGKTALNMLGLGEDTLLAAIQDEDDAILSSVPGIGKKTAQKIIVDLKGSMNFEKNNAKNAQKNAFESSPLVSSLVGMGYDKSRVEAVCATLDTSLSLEERVKIAIKNLS